MNTNQLEEKFALPAPGKRVDVTILDDGHFQPFRINHHPFTNGLGVSLEEVDLSAYSGGHGPVLTAKTNARNNPSRVGTRSLGDGKQSTLLSGEFAVATHRHCVDGTYNQIDQLGRQVLVQVDIDLELIHALQELWSNRDWRFRLDRRCIRDGDGDRDSIFSMSGVLLPVKRAESIVKTGNAFAHVDIATVPRHFFLDAIRADKGLWPHMTSIRRTS